ncbi:hypothetical protein [Alloactinosynnema sp. L-07]|uniref:hypothetical protein n=1 Tax=Alloactinosynnema sp. L-07 TaxID=1653480 RepID=UPI00065EFB1C|nr:hypothetical protein [Alloactinosynnema sp. L-07]CRK56968.1 hypothetical protein [Alloactinosynnema sp. L-07]
MSITFCAEVLDPSAHVVTCGCAQVTAAAVRYDSYAAAAEIVRRLREQAGATKTAYAVLPGCERPDNCSFLGPSTQPIYDNAGPQLQVSYATANLLLDALGYAELKAGEYSGSADSAEFLDRVLIALALPPADPDVLMPGRPCA